MASLSNLDIVNQVDSFPYFDTTDEKHHVFDIYTLLSQDSSGTLPQGCMHPPVLQALLSVPPSIRGSMTVDPTAHTILAFTSDSSSAARTARIANTFTHLLHQNTSFSLPPFKGELSPVYARDNVSVLYSVDRAVTELLGVVRFGVHLTAYVVDSTAPHGINIWIPTRASGRSYADMLDNFAAGGLMTGEEPLDGIVREAREEAGLPEILARDRIRPAGVVSYIHVGERLDGCGFGMVHPECHRVFDAELPAEFVPVPREGEVAGYRLCSVPEVQADLAAGRFKPNCGLVMLDFFIRRGIVTKESEVHYEEIKRRLRRHLPFPGPHLL